MGQPLQIRQKAIIAKRASDPFGLAKAVEHDLVGVLRNRFGKIRKSRPRRIERNVSQGRHQMLLIHHHRTETALPEMTGALLCNRVINLEEQGKRKGLNRPRQPWSGVPEAIASPCRGREPRQSQCCRTDVELHKSAPRLPDPHRLPRQQ